MTADKKESTALYSAMNRTIEALTSFDKRMQLLTASGLVAGTIPTSIRKRYGQAILDFASSQLDGENAEKLKADC